jgi:hypothetical protein
MCRESQNMRGQQAIYRDIVAAVDRLQGYEAVIPGRSDSVSLVGFARLIEHLAGHRAHLLLAPMMEAEISYGHADVNTARALPGNGAETPAT